MTAIKINRQRCDEESSAEKWIRESDSKRPHLARRCSTRLTSYVMSSSTYFHYVYTDRPFMASFILMIEIIDTVVFKEEFLSVDIKNN